MARLVHPLLVIPVFFALPLFAIGNFNPSLLSAMGNLLLLTVALLIVITAWRAADEACHGYFTCVAIGFLWLAVVRLLQFVVDGDGAALPSGLEDLDALGLGSRLLEGFTLLCAPYFLTHRLPRVRAVGVGAVITGGVLLLAWQTSSPFALADMSALSDALRAVVLLQLLAALTLLYWSRQRLPAVAALSLMTATALLLMSELVLPPEDAVGLAVRFAAYWLILAASLQSAATTSFRLDDGPASRAGAIREPTVLVDRHGRVLQANASALELAETDVGMGVTVIGGDGHALFHPRDMDRLECPICLAIADCRETSSFEWSYERAGRRYSVTLSPLFLPGREVRIVHIFRDVTDHQRCQRALDASEAKCRALLEHASDGVLLFDAGLRIVESSRRMAEMIGAERARLPGRPLEEYFTSEPTFRWASGLDALRSGESLLVELRLCRDDGTSLPVEMAVSAAEVGGPTVYVGGVRDVSRRVGVERALNESEARRRAIFEYAGLGIAVCAASRIVECNAAFLGMLGRTEAEVIGHHWWDLVHPDDRVNDCDLLEFTSDHQVRPLTRRFRYVRADGGIVWGETTVSAIVDDRGDIRFTIGMVMDITEQKRAEDLNREQQCQLHEARRVAEEASAAKSRFLAAASHDLRQPIQAIHLLLHLVRSQPMPEEERTIIERIGGAVDGLSNMLDTLLDISKLEAGLVVPDRCAFALAPVMRRVMGEFDPVATAKGLQLRLVDTGLAVYSDPKLLERILGNLLSNAVKYTQAGRILCGCRRRAGLVEIQVLDTGRGIPSAELGAIFGEFHQVGNKARDRREGLGLGLAIVERLCRLLEHPVRVRSTVGRGSVFSVLVPVARLHHRRKPMDPQQLGLAVGVAGAIVLVVDDENDIRDGLSALCAQWGYQVWEARDAEDALAVLREKRVAPDILLVDYRLPDGTGVELVTRIRRRFRRRIAALILTGDAAHQPLQDAEAAGIGIVHKPVPPDVLRTRLALQLSAGKRRWRR